MESSHDVAIVKGLRQELDGHSRKFLLVMWYFLHIHVITYVMDNATSSEFIPNTQVQNVVHTRGETAQQPSPHGLVSPEFSDQRAQLLRRLSGSTARSSGMPSPGWQTQPSAPSPSSEAAFRRPSTGSEVGPGSVPKVSVVCSLLVVQCVIYLFQSFVWMSRCILECATWVFSSTVPCIGVSLHSFRTVSFFSLPSLPFAF